MATGCGIGVSMHVQLAVADFMVDGGLRRHLWRMGVEYAASLRLLHDTLPQAGGGCVLPARPSGGLQLCAALLGPASDTEAVGRLRDAGLQAEPMFIYRHGEEWRGRQGLLLGIGLVARHEVVSAAQALARHSTCGAGPRLHVPLAACARQAGRSAERARPRRSTARTAGRARTLPRHRLCRAAPLAGRRRLAGARRLRVRMPTRGAGGAALRGVARPGSPSRRTASMPPRAVNRPAPTVARAARRRPAPGGSASTGTLRIAPAAR